MRKICIWNKKGGIGKSFLTVSLAFILSKVMSGGTGKVVILDFDAQCNSALYLGKQKSDFNSTFDDILSKKSPVSIANCLIEVRENLYVITNNELQYIESEFHRISRLDLVLNHYLKDLETLGFEAVIFDLPPTRTKLLDAVLMYCNNLIIPCSMQGGASINSIADTYELLSELYIPASNVKAIVPNFYNPQLRDCQENLQILQDTFGSSDLLTEPMPTRTAINLASKNGKTIFEIDNSDAAEKFSKIAERLVTVCE